MELGELDKSGRRRPIPIEGSEFKMNLDFFILAIGQGTDLTLLEAAHGDLEVDRWGKIITDELTMQTHIPNIFAGGDAIPGEGIAVRAIGHGNNAAVSIDRYLRGIDLKKNRIIRKHSKLAPIPKKEASKMPKESIALLPIQERLRSFNEVELPLTEESAIQEASRCLNCNICCSTSNIQECSYGIQPVVPYYSALDFLKIPRVVIGLLNQKEIVPVVLSNEKCCGHDNLWQGDTNTFEKLARHNVQLFNDAGVKTLILSCAEGYHTWKYEYPKLFKGTDEFNFEIYHVTEYILKERLIDDVKFPISEKIRVTYHDSCRLGRLSNVYDAPREVLNKIPFIELIEMESNKKDALC